MTGLESKMMKLIDYGQVSVRYHGKLWFVTCAHQFEGTGETLDKAATSCLNTVERSMK